ncbi:MAG: DUF1800 domain-containing protein [Bryobacterales bacterium]|nr:DUF1800 domain-containing protein [Bryobacterales bacterium]
MRALNSYQSRWAQVLQLLLITACATIPLAANAVSTAAEAALFLEQATWGPKPQEISRVMSIGKAAYVDEQLALPPTQYPAPETNDVLLPPYQRLFFHYGVHNPDQLRQRVAFALSQIFVVSGNTLNRAHMMVPYLNLLSEGAFGNYRELLMNVSLSPAMGRYLDNVNNVKPDPARGTSANENYAREFLQLLTLGTELLNDDATPVKNQDGNPVPVYSEDTVKQMANAITGWTWAPTPGQTVRTPRNPAYYGAPMIAWEPNHDTTAKTLLNGYQMPAGRTAREDLEGAITHIFEHPNVGPFVSIRLIRSLVSSNPSPAYVRDVVRVFNNNGSGVRGDLKAVVRAILLHPEASAPLALSGRLGVAQGHLAEPVFFVLKLMRALDSTVAEDNNLMRHCSPLGQNVFFPPSVFSYYHLDHALTKQELAAPEFEIHTSATAVERANFVGMVVDRRLGPGVSHNLDSLLALAPEPMKLIEELSLRITHGTLPDESKEVVRRFVVGTNDPAGRVGRALYLVANSPQAWVSGARISETGRRAPSGRRGAILR